jgi:hypothetical protein
VAELEGNVQKIWILGNFRTWVCHRFEQKSVLSEYCDTGLLRAVWRRNTLLELCNLRPACLNFAIMDLFCRKLRHGTYISDLCHTRPVCQIFLTFLSDVRNKRPIFVRILRQDTRL